MSLYVDHTGGPLVDHTGDPLEHYGRVPIGVMSDGRLRHCDVRVYAALASPVYQGSTASIGLRELARLSTVARRKVHESLLRLEACGHVRREAQGKGRRMVYILTSTTFAKKQGKVDAVVSGRRGKRLVSVARKVG